jgi:hypothetical protein
MPTEVQATMCVDYRWWLACVLYEPSKHTCSACACVRAAPLRLLAALAELWGTCARQDVEVGTLCSLALWLIISLMHSPYTDATFNTHAGRCLIA